MLNGLVKFKNVYFVLMSMVLVLGISSCASTSLTQSWKQPELEDQTFEHLLIIGVSDSQQTRRIYENHFVEQLAKRKIRATPSYSLIDSKQIINRETVVNAVRNTDIDSALVTYLVSVDNEVIYHDSPLNPGYSGSPDANMISATLITNRGRSSNSEVISLKSDFYDVTAESMLWSAQTRTVAPDSIDQTIIEVTELLINKLFDDDILK